MQNFLNNSTKLIEAILNEQRMLQSKALNTSKQSKLDFCVGYKGVSLPEFLFFSSDETLNVTNCAFCSNDEQYFVVTFNYKHKTEYFNKTILIVCNIDDLDSPYRYMLLAIVCKVLIIIYFLKHSDI